ncbi:metallophosphoesterase [Candidatus Woesearchaeota archaeon]|nr:metallophosphoesterase [Candidatus Pacearchaeota archaeon]MBI4452136.1 metallophosphoesterase [Candidatus Woesearchaeota archaeon]
MKLLAFTDIHGSLAALKRIKQKVNSQNPDILVCAGDISIFEHGIGMILKKLNRLNKKIVIVHGNHEDDSTFRKYSKIFRNIIFIHKRYHIETNLLFLGFGGGGFSIRDKDFENLANENFKKIIKQNSGKKIILVTHAPPYGTKLDKLGRSHAGSKSFRNFIEKYKVDLHVCGHLHENFGKEDRIGKTEIINPGPFGKIVKV